MIRTIAAAPPALGWPKWWALGSQSQPHATRVVNGTIHVDIGAGVCGCGYPMHT